MPRIRSIKPQTLPTVQEPAFFECCLYLICESDGHLTKVGIAKHVHRRLMALQCGNPRPLSIAACYEGSRKDCLEVERAVLKRFVANVERSEWLRTNPANIKQFIAEVANEA